MPTLISSGKLEAKRVAILYNDTAYGQGLHDEMQRALTERGAEIVLAREVAEGQDRYLDEVESSVGPTRRHLLRRLRDRSPLLGRRFNRSGYQHSDNGF